MRKSLDHEREIALSCGICEDIRELRSTLSLQLGAVLEDLEGLS
jgi:hypothetical protein